MGRQCRGLPGFLSGQFLTSVLSQSGSVAMGDITPRPRLDVRSRAASGYERQRERDLRTIPVGLANLRMISMSQLLCESGIEQ